ncbi:unnamed protein product, partial [Adineta steineri]
MSVLICLIILIQPYLNIASITIQDPGDIIDISKDTADNAIKANYNVMPVMYLLSPLQATSFFNGTQSSSWISHQTFSATANDTNVIVVGNGAQLNLSFVNIVKTGYSSNLLQASFFGVNAAINIQNG